MTMDRIRTIEHRGKEILIVDVSNSRGAATSIDILAKAREQIDSRAPKSLLLLTDVTNTHYDAGGAEAMKQYSRANTPYIKASAVIGVVGIKRVLFSAVVKLTGRQIATCDTVEAGLDWLAAQ
jgi:hypothetical protein